MSRSYRVKIPVEILIPSSLRDKEWKFNVNFSLLDILPRAQMLELLAEELKQAGFEDQEGSLVKTLNPNSSIVFDLDSVSATIKIANIALKREFSTFVEAEVLAAFQQSMLDAAKNNRTVNLQQAVDAQDALKNEAIKAMTAAATEAKVVINSALKDVYRTAITAKAQKMANVTSVTETSEDGTFRIRVEMET